VQPSPDKLAAFGFREEDFDDDTLDIWPCHWDAVLLFQALQTQWRTVGGMAGILFTGLDYTALPIVETRLGITCPPPIFEALQALEAEGLRHLNRRD